MKNTVEMVPLCMYIVVSHYVITAPHVRCVGCVFALLYTLVDDLEYNLVYFNIFGQSLCKKRMTLISTL